MKQTLLILTAITGVLARPVMAQTRPDAAVRNQWFTGSLEAPSPALPKAGLLAVEPYGVYVSITGAYDSLSNRHAVAGGERQTESITAIKFGFTDRLSLEALPSFLHVWNGSGSHTGVGDLPLELEYRFSDENGRTGMPSVTMSVGTSVPTGKFDRLASSLDGLGTGASTLKAGLLLQSLFDTWGSHPMRIRFYGVAFEPAGNVSVQGISVYGTGQGYHGIVAPGFASIVGIGGGYALNQRWVLAIDLLQNRSDGFRLTGTDSTGAVANASPVSSMRTSVAPAVEFNLSGRVGLIGGLEFSFTGRNRASYLSPQVALSMVF